MRDTAPAANDAPENAQTAEPVSLHDTSAISQTARDLEVQLTMRSLFQQIDDARVEQGLTTAEVARRAGLSESYVSHLLIHGGNPRLSTLIRLTHAVGGRLAVVKDDGSSYDC